MLFLPNLLLVCFIFKFEIFLHQHVELNDINFAIKLFFLNLSMIIGYIFNTCS